MIPPEYIDWGAGSPADRRKLIGEIYSQIKKAAGFARPPRFPASGPAAGADVANPIGISAGPFQRKAKPAYLDAPPCRIRLSCFLPDGRRAAKIVNGRK